MGIIRNFKKIKIRRDKIYCEKRNFILKSSSLFTSSHVFRQPLQQVEYLFTTFDIYMLYLTMLNTINSYSIIFDYVVYN